MSELPEEEMVCPDYGQTFYMVLQGEFALYHRVNYDADHDTLLIMAPRVEGHSYKAGPWLSDWSHRSTDLSPLRLCLEDACGEKKVQNRHSSRVIPEQCDDIFIRLGPEAPRPDLAYLTIEAPMPLAIIPGRMESTPSVYVKVLHGDDPPTFPPVAPCPTVIPILVYKYYGDKVPYLTDGEGHKWYPEGPPAFKSLQVYASGFEANTERGKCHAQHAFHEMARLLGIDASIDWEEPNSDFVIQWATPPAGLSWAQVNLFLHDVQRWSRDGRKDLLTAESVPQNVVPFLADSGNCGPGTGK